MACRENIVHAQKLVFLCKEVKILNMFENAVFYFCTLSHLIEVMAPRNREVSQCSTIQLKGLTG